MSPINQPKRAPWYQVTLNTPYTHVFKKIREKKTHSGHAATGGNIRVHPKMTALLRTTVDDTELEAPSTRKEKNRFGCAIEQGRNAMAKQCPIPR